MTLEKLAFIIMEFKQDVDNKFKNLKEYVDDRFGKLENRVDNLEKNFNDRLDKIENRLDKLEICPTIAHELKNLN